MKEELWRRLRMYVTLHYLIYDAIYSIHNTLYIIPYINLIIYIIIHNTIILNIYDTTLHDMHITF